MLVLNTGRVRDHWHTMTRTGKAARLSAHMAEPFAELHPDDAASRGIRHASLVQLENRHGSALVRALISDRQQKGAAFVPMHWTGQFSGAGRIDVLVTAQTDPQSGQPALKSALVVAEPALVSRYGFAVSAREPQVDGADYWAIARAEGGWRTELAFLSEPDNWDRWARAAFGVEADTHFLTINDSATGRQSFALFEGKRLVFALFLSPDPVLVSRQWAVTLLGEDITPARRSDVLAGRPGADRPDPGPTICVCFGVGANQIAAAARGGCHTVEAIGGALKAGTNCGSCRNDIRALVDSNRVALIG
jgi:assimilatory nitrate reductase catalytic subunit